MGNATLIRAAIEISSPLPNTPFVPNIVSNLRYQVRLTDFAGTPGFTNGSPVPDFTTTLGSASGREMQWGENGNAGAGWTKPTWSATGGPNNGPGLQFSRANSLKNFDGGGAVYQAAGAHTQYIVFKPVQEAGGFGVLASQIASGAGADTQYRVAVNPNQIQTVTAAGSIFDAFLTSAAQTSWALLVNSINGTSSLNYLTGDGISVVNQTAVDNAGLILGRLMGLGYSSGYPNFAGVVAEWGWFDRALTASDITGLASDVNSRLGIVV